MGLIHPYTFLYIYNPHLSNNLFSFTQLVKKNYYEKFYNFTCRIVLQINLWGGIPNLFYAMLRYATVRYVTLLHAAAC